jgi:hypothetical protein
MAAPVYLPADPEIGAPAVPALPERRSSFVRNTDLLLREQHDGPAWPSVVGYGGLAFVVAVWLALLVLAAQRMSPQSSAPARSRPQAQEPASPPPPAPTGGNGHGDSDPLRQWRESLTRVRNS